MIADPLKHMIGVDASAEAPDELNISYGVSSASRGEFPGSVRDSR